MTELIRGPQELWRELTTRGGLDVDYQAEMDKEFMENFARYLGAPVPAAVADPSLTTEQFVGALMKALGPFSRMLADLLVLFERAGARTTDASLQIEFDFRHAPPLSFSLETFRDWMRAFERVRESTTVRRWTLSQLWALNSALSGSSTQTPTPASAWAAEYDRRLFTLPDLPEPSSGQPELDRYLRQAFGVWRSVMSATVAVAGTREELRELTGNRYPDYDSDDWSPLFLSGLHNDYWPKWVIESIYRLADSARTDPAGGEAAAARLRAFFDSVPRTTIEEERVIESLLAFLNLPAWQQRHELYSAWVFTLIAEALEPRGLQIHHDGGRLSFAFGGSHLATANAGGPRLHVWAELRSPLPRRSLLSGRTAIQPDYSLVADPITGRGSAVAVVEVKQYNRPKKKNFSNAVIDYATGRPNATIFLTSYGPADDRLFGDVPADMSPRLHVFSNLRPDDDERRAAFRDELRAAVERWFGNATAEPAAAIVRIPVAATPNRRIESVQLTWRAQPRDLDLHLSVAYEGQWYEVNYTTKGMANEYPWAALDRDATAGFGPETVTIAKVLDAVYRCVVVNYSGDAPLRDSEATVSLRHDGTAIAVGCPKDGDGTYWHVFDYDGRTGRIEIVNRIVPVMPGASPDP